MLTRGEIIFKWVLYTAVSALFLLVQTAVLQRVTVWGVIPFLYPLLPVLTATFEGPFSGTVFSLAAGVFCDMLLPAPIPCFYTVILPAAGLLCALMAKSLPAGFLCSLASAAVVFAMTDLAMCLLLWSRGGFSWSAGLGVAAREFCVTLPWTFPVTALLRFVYARTHLDD